MNPWSAAVLTHLLAGQAHNTTREGEAMGSHIGLRLAALEVIQREGGALSQFDHGTLTAARRSGDAELVERAATIARVEDVRARKRTKAQARARRAEESD
jgi:hypothetical protein